MWKVHNKPENNRIVEYIRIFQRQLQQQVKQSNIILTVYCVLHTD